MTGADTGARPRGEDQAMTKEVETKIQRETKAAVARVIERYRNDADYRRLMNTDASAALAREGLVLPDGAMWFVHRDTADTVHCVFPFRELEGRMNDNELEAVAGGVPNADSFVSGGRTPASAYMRAYRQASGFHGSLTGKPVSS